jgi:cation transport ATPase
MAGNGIIDAPALATITNSKQDPGFAFFYNALGVPEAAGLLHPVFGLLLSPMIAALAIALAARRRCIVPR